MTRNTTRFPSSAQQQSVEIASEHSDFCRLIAFLVLVVFATVAALIFTNPIQSLGDPSDQFTVKQVPREYTRLENIVPEDREVFHGFETSFLPKEEIIMARNRRKRALNKVENLFDKDNTDFWWWSEEPEPNERVRYKRDVNKDTVTSKLERVSKNKKLRRESKTRTLEDDDSNEQDTNVEDKRDCVLQPCMHIDRGPLDDVIEQVRGQPELEEGEMGTSAHLYKPARSYTVQHAFWKGQGDRDTIRETQANIMKQYMDETADPCKDFYQYACGNWATLNPIPADKAGSDTFEMLRENLDNVLKYLLEFKPNENIMSIFPGQNLDLSDNFLTGITQTDKIGVTKTHKNAQIIERIRRYLDMKMKKLKNTLKKIKGKPIYKKKKKHRKYEMKKRVLMKKRSKRRSREKSKTKIIKSLKSDAKVKSVIKRELQNSFTSKQNLKITAKRHSPNPKDPANGDAALKARFLFKSCMNHDILSKRGHQPLIDLLKLLGGWPILDPVWDGNNFDWLELMAKLRIYNNDILISQWVGPDIKNSDEFVIQFDQTSLGLPTREYFLQPNNKAYLKAYKTYLTRVALLLGGEPSHVKKSAEKLIDFESRLAMITSTPEDRRNVSEIYKRMTLEKLEELVPQVKWQRYLNVVMNRTVKPQETVVLFALSYVQELVRLVEEEDKSTVANYLLWRFVRHRVNNLDDRFQQAKQHFYFVLFGREEAPPRWKNCISQVNSNMGMALGSMFVQKYFDETSKNDTMTMTKEIQQSFREILHLTDWIDEDTKLLAAHKVDAMMLRIGYPDFILNKKELDDRYKEVVIHPDKYFENILNILQHLTKMEQARIGQPVNKTLWNTAPAVVNAYYSRNKNQIMFPAGILQPPFYHRHFPRSLNYGGIGVVIGHEITHGFDDKGRLFDCHGNLHRWWSDSAIKAFHERAQCLIDQYGAYVVPEVNVQLDGVTTQGENIADNGGVKQAFRAYARWLQKNGGEGETLPGLNHSHTQLFFLNFAQVWCGAMRPEAVRSKLKTAVHAPGRFRVIGTLANSRDFAREFQCPPGTPMNPIKKCSVW